MKVTIERKPIFSEYTKVLPLLRKDSIGKLDMVELFITKEDINFELEFEKFTKNKHSYTDKVSLTNMYNVIYILKVFYSNGILYVNDELYDLAMNKFRRYMEEPIVEHVQVVDKRLTDTKHDYPTLKGTLVKCNKIRLKDEDSNDVSLERIIGPWLKICQKHNEYIQLSLTKKFDGTSIVLSLNDNGKVKKAISRGDEDDKGIDVTHLFKHLKFNNTFKCGLKTECIMTQDDLDEYSKVKNYNYKNLRVAPVSVLTSIDSVKYSKYLTLVPLKCSVDGIDNSYFQEYFPSKVTNDATIISQTGCMDKGDLFELIEECIDLILKERKDLNYAIDGVVISCLNKSVIKEMGRKNNINKYEVAYKFPPMVRYSKCTGFDFTVGRTGLITPMIKYEPVEFFGGIHNKSTLSSYLRFRKLGLKYGDTLIITYNNDVMPYVRKFQDNDGKEIKFPTKCKCGHKLELVGANYYCKNPECFVKVLNILSFFFKKLGVVGFSEKTISKLKDAGEISKIRDLFYLDYNSISKLEGFGTKKINNLRDEINKLKEREIDEAKLVSALSLCGEKNARAMLSRMTIRQILEDYEQLYKINIENIGDTTKTTFIKNLLEYKNIVLELMDILNIVQVKEKNNIMKVVLSGFRDKHLQETLEEYGIEFGSSVTKNTNYLIVKDLSENSSKVKRANKYNIPVITINDFLKMIREDIEIEFLN